MKQTILALVRPKLNLSQPENQLTHLIEHVLMSPERQGAISLEDGFFAKDIIFEGGYTSELYNAEYYVVRSESAGKIKKIILSNKNNLFIEKLDLESAAAALIEELKEKQTKEISIVEQWERAIYEPTSPSVLQPWFDVSKLKGVSKNQVERVFNKFKQPAELLELSFDRYTVPSKIKTKKNLLHKKRTVYLTHPQQPAGISTIDILVPLKTASAVEDIVLPFYVKSLSDIRFGVLIDELRHLKGLIYHLSVNYNLYANALQISFSCQEENVKESVRITKELMNKYESKIEKHFDILRERVFIDYQLEWSNIKDYVLFYIEETFLGKIEVSPKERIDKLRSLNKKGIINFHKKINQLLKSRYLVTVLNYSDKVSTKNLLDNFLV